MKSVLNISTGRREGTAPAPAVVPAITCHLSLAQGTGLWPRTFLDRPGFNKLQLVFCGQGLPRPGADARSGTLYVIGFKDVFPISFNA